MKRNRVWIEIVMLATAIACALALLFATLGAAAGVAVGEVSTPPQSYQPDDQAKAKPFVGKQVKVTGKLEMKSNTIHIEGIEPLS